MANATKTTEPAVKYEVFIPEDIWIHVSRFLDLKICLQSARLVSKLFHRIFFFRLGSITYNGFALDKLQARIKYLRRFDVPFRYFQRLILTHDKNENPLLFPVLPTAFSELLKDFRAIRTLSFMGSPDSELAQAMLNAVPWIEKLAVTQKKFRDALILSAVSLDAQTALRSITIHAADLNAFRMATIYLRGSLRALLDLEKLHFHVKLSYFDNNHPMPEWHHYNFKRTLSDLAIPDTVVGQASFSHLTALCNLYSLRFIETLPIEFDRAVLSPMELSVFEPLHRLTRLECSGTMVPIANCCLPKSLVHLRRLKMCSSSLITTLANWQLFSRLESFEFFTPPTPDMKIDNRIADLTDLTVLSLHLRLNRANAEVKKLLRLRLQQLTNLTSFELKLTQTFPPEASRMETPEHVLPDYIPSLPRLSRLSLTTSYPFDRLNLSSIDVERMRILSSLRKMPTLQSIVIDIENFEWTEQDSDNFRANLPLLHTLSVTIRNGFNIVAQ